MEIVLENGAPGDGAGVIVRKMNPDASFGKLDR